MKATIKTPILLILLVFNFSCAQTTMRSVADAKKIDVNKNEFIGKPLRFLLSKMNVEIKSTLPAPNKNRNEINRITFRFINDYEYRKNSSKQIKDRPTQLTVVFNQNWDFNGIVCKNTDPNCNNWTKEDEKNLGGLIVYDIYVLGKE